MEDLVDQDLGLPIHTIFYFIINVIIPLDRGE